MSGFNFGKQKSSYLVSLLGFGLLSLAVALMGMECPQAGDSDGDGVADAEDNCPSLANADQADADGDGAGDACDDCPNDADDDADGDGVCGDVDNCPADANAGQGDSDGDGVGDACDDCPSDPDNDADGDGICGDVDNCPDDANAGQGDSDGDGVGDACDDTDDSVAVSAGDDDTAGGGTTVNLTALVTNGTAPFTFSWQVTATGDAGTATLNNADTQTPSVDFSSDAEGTFTLEVTVTDANGNSASDSVDYELTPSGSSASLTFTLNIDNLTGTDGDDTFTAPSELVGGVQTATLQTADRAAGGAGTDTLNSIHPAATNFTPAATTGIEIWNLSLFANLTFAAANVTGVTEINSVDSTGNLTVTGLGALPDFGLMGTGAAQLLPTLTTAATSAADDDCTLSLSGVTAGSVFTFTTGAANGIETLDIVSSGGVDNVLTTLGQTTGTSLVTCNVTGDTSLQIVNALPATITTVDANAFTGNLDVILPATNTTVTGGTGDDIIGMGANYTTDDTLDGGDGTDALELDNTDANVGTTAQANVTNFETLTITELFTGTTTTSSFGSITTVNLDVGMNAGALTVPASSTVNYGEEGTNTATSTGASGITVSGVGISDSLTLALNDADTGVAQTVTVTGVETLDLQSNLDLDGTAADTVAGTNRIGNLTMVPTAGNGTINVTGTEDLTVALVITAGTINAGSFTENLLMTLNTTGATTTSTTATGITGGAGNDILVGSTGADTMSAGGGNNQVQPGRGIDFVSFDSGSNILDLEDLAVAQAIAANRVTATGLTFSGTTYSTTNEEDGIRFDNLGTLGDLSDGAVAAEFQTVTTPGNYTMAAGQSVLELAFEFSPAANLGAGGANELNGTTLLSAAGALTGTTAATITTANADDDIVIIAYQGDDAYIYHGNGGGGNTALVAAEINLIAIISGGVTVGGINVDNVLN